MTPLVKQPSESLLYDQPVAVNVASVSAVIATAKGMVAEITPLSIASFVFSANIIQSRIEGGTDGERYLITYQGTDVNGDTFEHESELLVQDLTFAVPDAGAAITYIAPDAYVNRFGLDETIRLTDELGIGQIYTKTLFAALADAAAEIDTYLANRYQVPLSPVPAAIVEIAANLARYKLHGDMTSDTVRQRYEDSVKALNNFARGVTELPGAQAQPETSDTPVFDGPGRTFTNDTLEGF